MDSVITRAAEATLGRFIPLRSVSDALVRDVDCAAVDCVCNHSDELDSLLTSSASRLLH